MVLSANDIRILSKSLLNGAGFLVCAPKRKMELDNRPLPVRAFFQIQQRLPVYESGLVGRGAIMVSEAGRARFAQFPDETADDLFLDSLFGPTERTIVDGVTCSIEGPYTTRDLLRRITRVRRGNIQLRQTELTTSKTDQPVRSGAALGPLVLAARRGRSPPNAGARGSRVRGINAHCRMAGTPQHRRAGMGARRVDSTRYTGVKTSDGSDETR